MAVTTTPLITGPKTVARAVNATYVAFSAAGFAFASWASRIPQVRDHLHLSSAGLGLVLLALAVGSVIALPLAGVVVHRLGSQRTVALMSVLLATSLAITAVGYLGGVLPVVIGLFLLGFANGAWDVAMNVQGAGVERLLGRAIMPRFHAGYSVGTVAGALIGALMVTLRVPVTAHLLGAAVVVAVTVPLGVRGFLPDVLPYAERTGTGSGPGDTLDAVRTEATRSRTGGAFTRWREPRTLLIGLFVLAFAFAEGTGNDWISVSSIDGHRTSAALGTLALALFLTAMTVGRWFGPPLLDRYGRVTVVRMLAVVAVAGLLVWVFSPVVWVAFGGTLLWGLGASLGFPVGMSAAADEPAAAAGRVSVVASIGYCAFLAGPPFIGLLGEHTTVLHALTTAAVLLAVAASLANALRAP